MDILEKKISHLKLTLKKTEKELALLKLDKYLDDFAKEHDEFSHEEIKLISQLLFGYYICREYDQSNIIDAEVYLIKVAEFLGSFPEEVLVDFGEIFKKFEEIENHMEDAEISSKLNFFIDNSSQLNEDNLFEIFC